MSSPFDIRSVRFFAVSASPLSHGRRWPCLCLVVMGMGLVTGCAPLVRTHSRALQRYEFSQVHMGTYATLTFYASGPATAKAAAEAAFARIAQLDRILSDYDAQSELMQLSLTSGSGRAVPVSDDLWNVLTLAQKVARRTDGAFDITVGPYVRLWRRASRRHELPSPRLLKKAEKAVGYQYIQLHPENQTVTLTRENMRLDAGGIGKGYAAREALEVLREHGISRALVNLGGDLAVGDPPPGKSGWQILLAPMLGRIDDTPGATGRLAEQTRAPDAADDSSAGERTMRFASMLTIANAGIAVSGDAVQYVKINGTRYSHIVNPHTGMGLTHRMGVVVVAPDPALADALATAVSVLGPEEGIKLINNTPGAATIIVRNTGEGFRTYRSRRVEQLHLEPVE